MKLSKKFIFSEIVISENSEIKILWRCSPVAGQGQQAAIYPPLIQWMLNGHFDSKIGETYLITEKVSDPTAHGKCSLMKLACTRTTDE